MSRRGKERWRRASGGSPYVEADDVAVDNGRKADGKSLPVGAVSDRELSKQAVDGGQKNRSAVGGACGAENATPLDSTILLLSPSRRGRVSGRTEWR